MACGCPPIQLPLTQYRSVQLPPVEDIWKCAGCQKRGIFRFCGGCGEVLYCSVSCQTKDWKNHRVSCKSFIRLDIAKLWPFLALMFGHNRLLAEPENPLHPATLHRIMGSFRKDPSTSCYWSTLAEVESLGIGPLPGDLSTSCLHLLLGERLDTEAPNGPLDDWWPPKGTNIDRGAIFRRIEREGLVLPNCVAICVSLLAELYTMGPTFLEEPVAPRMAIRVEAFNRPQVRLKAGNYAISDFGIAKGVIKVKEADQLMYMVQGKGEWKGQEPDDHYWIYFTTVKGDDYILDCGAYSLGFPSMVSAKPYKSYFASNLTAHTLDHVPAVFEARKSKDNSASCHPIEETKRFSFLWDRKLYPIVKKSAGGFECKDCVTVQNKMDEIAGRTCSREEKILMSKWMTDDCAFLKTEVEQMGWKNWPEKAPLQTDGVDVTWNWS